MSKSIIGKLSGLFVTAETDKTPVVPPEESPSIGGDAWAKWEKLAQGEVQDGTPLTSVIARQPGPNLDSVTVTVPVAPANKPVDDFVMPKKKEDGTWDFTPIYLHSNLQPPAFTAEQARDIIATLPESLPLDIRRETVSKTIGAIGKTLGVTPEIIASDAALKIVAVEDFRKQVSGRFDEYANKAQLAIAEHERKIAETKSSIEQAKSRSMDVMSACDAEVDKLDDVTEFFTLDQGSSKHVKPVATGV